MVYNLIGIGAGVFNLSLAALLDDIQHSSHLFLEAKEEFSWYPGLDTEVSELQEDYLGDLVTLTNPTSKFSFLSYIHERGLMYQFIGRKLFPLSRRIYAEYFSWASKKLSSIQFDSAVENIDYDGSKFIIRTKDELFYARNIALGVGIKQKLPSFAKHFIGQHIYHSSVYSERNNDLEGKTVAVIGGGQSSAEVLLDIVNKCTPKKVIWIAPCIYHAPLDETAINYDIWSPTFLHEFYKLHPETKKSLNQAVINTSDGITLSTLDNLYVKLFDKKYFDAEGLSSIILTNTHLEDIAIDQGNTFITVNNKLFNKKYEFPVDELIMATGYTQSYKDSLTSLIEKFPELNSENILDKDFSLKWRHSSSNKIYVQNGGVNEYSIFEKSLLLASWRSSMIINSLMGKEIFKGKPDISLHSYPEDLAPYEVPNKIIGLNARLN